MGILFSSALRQRAFDLRFRFPASHFADFKPSIYYTLLITSVMIAEWFEMDL